MCETVFPMIMADPKNLAPSSPWWNLRLKGFACPHQALQGTSRTNPRGTFTLATQLGSQRWAEVSETSVRMGAGFRVHFYSTDFSELGNQSSAVSSE